MVIESVVAGVRVMPSPDISPITAKRTKSASARLLVPVPAIVWSELSTISNESAVTSTCDIAPSALTASSGISFLLGGQRRIDRPAQRRELFHQHREREGHVPLGPRQALGVVTHALVHRRQHLARAAHPCIHYALERHALQHPLQRHDALLHLAHRLAQERHVVGALSYRFGIGRLGHHHLPAAALSGVRVKRTILPPLSYSGTRCLPKSCTACVNRSIPSVPKSVAGCRSTPVKLSSSSYCGTTSPASVESMSANCDTTLS